MRDFVKNKKNIHVIDPFVSYGLL